MDTTVSRRGQTVIPSEIRKRHHIEEGDHLQWIDDGASIRVVPIPATPLNALRGCAVGEGLSDRLFAARRRDRDLEG